MAPSRVAVDLAVMLGGGAIVDLAILRNLTPLFGPVASDPTAWRVLSNMVPGLVLDLDATMVICHSEKESATSTWKKTFGYHPLLCYLDGSREALSGLLREGRAGSNTTADHITVLDQALHQIPDTHRYGTPISGDHVEGMLRMWRPWPEPLPPQVAIGCNTPAMNDFGRRSPWRTAVLLAAPLTLVTILVGCVASQIVSGHVNDCCPQIEQVDSLIRPTTVIGLIVDSVAAGLTLGFFAVRWVWRRRTDPRVYGYDDRNDHPGPHAWRDSLGVTGAVGIIAGILTMNTGTILNTRLDHSPTTTRRATVVDKTIKTIKTTTTYYLVVRAWRQGDSGRRVRIPVRQTTFENTTPGDELVLAVHGGYLGIEWVQRP